MAETKYGKYFITETPPNPLHPQSRVKGNPMPWENTIYINDELNQTLKGAFYLETNMVLRKSEGPPPESGGGGKPHNHAFDEYLIFLGTDPEDLFDLGGEVELWVGDEKHIITKTCVVFVPKGTYHTPLYIHRVDRPFMFITTGSTPRYRHLSYTKDPRWANYAAFDDEKAELPPIVKNRRT